MILILFSSQLCDDRKAVSEHDIVNVAKSVYGDNNIDEYNVVKWMKCDVNDPGFEHLTNKQMVNKTFGIFGGYWKARRERE